MMVAEYQRRRDIIVDGLNSLPGIHCLKPQGAFYAFPNIQKTNKSSDELANLMLDGGVAVLPGSAFGEYGEGYLRVVFANSVENIKRALGRMENVLKRLV
jgi:aspartate/methionine/tyrosine aminotransferase